MSAGGERHSGDCIHGNLKGKCWKCRETETEAELVRLRAENERLREALSEIYGDCLHIADAVSCAKAALEGK